MMNGTIYRCAVLFPSLFLAGLSLAQEGLTITQESGTTISVEQNTLIDMITSDTGVETYVLTPAVPSEPAGVTILESEGANGDSDRSGTKVTGKKITIWLQSSDQEGQEKMDFLVEGEARLIQGSDHMYGPKSIEFIDQNLTILGVDGKEGDLFYTFKDGRRVDWQGQGLRMTFKVDQDGRYLLKGFKTLDTFTRLNFFHPRLKGGIGHLIPLGQSREATAADPGRKVTPAK